MNSLPYRLASLFGKPFRWLWGVFVSTVHGDAKWMSRREIRRFLNPGNTGLVLSPKHRLSSRESFRNLVLAAPPGVGKTTQYVIPNVLHAEGSVVVTDPAGEIFRATSGHLQDRGFRIQVLQPADLTRSLCFNPLRYWRRPQELRQLATILAYNCSGRMSDPFWTISAINVLYIALSALVNVEDQRFINLPNLRWLLNHMGAEESTGVHYFMARYLEHDDPRMFSEYLAFQAQERKVKASVLSSARASLELWSDPDVCRFTATDSVAIEDLRKRPTAVYIIVPEHQVEYFGILVNLYYSACFRHCLEEHSPNDLPVFFLMDEFGNLGHINGIASIINTIRKRRCSISIILQELSQLRAVYGPQEAQTIFGGCVNKLYFSGLDLETTEYIEKSLGKNTEYDTTFGGIDDRARTIGVPLMSSDQVRMLRASEGILISGRERPIKLKMPPYFRVPAWKRLTEKPPAAPAFPSPVDQVEYLDLAANHQLKLDQAGRHLVSA